MKEENYIEVDKYVMGQYKGKTRISKNSLTYGLLTLNAELVAGKTKALKDDIDGILKKEKNNT